MLEHRRTTVRRRVLATGAALAAAVTVGALLPASADAATAPRPIVSGWIYGSAASVATVTANADLFAEVSPFWYSMKGSAGSVSVRSKVSTSSIPSVVSTLHAAHVKVVPTVTDETGWRQMSAQLSTASGRSAVVGLLVGLVTTNGFDGIDLDWEQFAFNDGSSSWTTTRAGWVPFVQSLAAALHAKGRTLYVTVPAGASTSSDSTGYWVYAWSQIGPVVDRLRIMAYDYSPSRPGPIAPYPWVQAVVAHAVTQVPAGKIQIGVPAYGRDWQTATAGTCPTLAPAAATSAQAKSFLDDLSWSTSRHAFTARVGSSYVNGRFGSNPPGVSLVQAPAPSWNTTQKERTYAYRVGFTGRIQPATVTATAVGGVAGGTTITVAAPAGIATGATATGIGIAAGATVASVAGNVVALSAPNTGTVTGAVSFTTTWASTTATGSPALPQTVTVADATGVAVGQTVTGTGIPAGATVTAVAGNVVTLSLPLAADVTDVPVTFTTTVTTTAPGGVTGGSTVVLASTSGVRAGGAVSGTGVAAGATVSSLAGNVATLSRPNTGNVTGTLTIKPAPVTSSCTISRVGWYSDAQSAVARAALVGTYQLAGIAEWTIGGEDTAQWSGLRAYARTIAQVPTAVTITAPTSLYAGRRATLRATMYASGKPLAGARAVFQWQPAGSTSWTTVGTATAASTGVATLVAPAVFTSGRWRAVAPGTWSRYTGSAVAAPTKVVRAPASVALTAPSRVVSGAAATARARLVSLGAPVVGATVVFSWQRAGSTAWVVLGSVRTDSTGTAAKAYRPVSSGSWRVAFAGSRTVAPVTSTAVRTSLVPVVKPVALTVRVARGVPAAVRAVVSPRVAYGPVVVQRHTSAGWRTVATVRTDSYGRVALRVSTRARGTTYWRFVVPGTVLHLSAVSRTVTVSVV
jgi:spore germination protein YaaH